MDWKPVGTPSFSNFGSRNILDFDLFKFDMPTERGRQVREGRLWHQILKPQALLIGTLASRGIQAAWFFSRGGGCTTMVVRTHPTHQRHLLLVCLKAFIKDYWFILHLLVARLDPRDLELGRAAGCLGTCGLYLTLNPKPYTLNHKPWTINAAETSTPNQVRFVAYPNHKS